MKGYLPLLGLSIVFVGTIAVLGIFIEMQLAAPSYDARKESACFAAPTDKCLTELKNECAMAGGRWEGHVIAPGKTRGCNLPTKDGGKG